MTSNQMRTEHDSLGTVQVPAEAYWGAQTERSRRHFPQGTALMPLRQIYALAQIKKAAAIVNERVGKLDAERRKWIVSACEEILEGKWDDQFPLVVWQTGSGTQTNMNVNEVIAHRGNEMAGKELLHPNDHVNCSQSSNDVFPSAILLSSVQALDEELLPAMLQMEQQLHALSEKYAGLVKTGRTHLQDATPITLGQEISAWEAMIRHGRERLLEAREHLLYLPIGGTAVGTGLNAPEDFDEEMCKQLEVQTGLKCRPVDNKFFGLSSQSMMAAFHGQLKALAADLYKMASDIRFLSCGPRCGIGELTIPANEPGSSIMPGKVNPTQVESLTMICLQVFGHDVSVSMAASQGQAQLNVYLPLILNDTLESVTLLSKGMEGFTAHLLEGLKANEANIALNLHRSLMLVTALTPEIGYENAAKIALHAHRNGLTLREAALELKLISAERFDALVDPGKMI